MKEERLGTADLVFASASRRCTAAPRRFMSLCNAVVVTAFCLIVFIGMTACSDGGGYSLSGDKTASFDAASVSQSSAFEGTGVMTIGQAEAHDMMVSDRVVILDVRTQEEYDTSHIVNARLLPVDDIDEATASEVAPDRDAPVLVYCRTGVRSAQAAEKLAALGYGSVYDFGGIVSWTYGTIDAEADEGGTVENDETPVGVKVVCGNTKAIPEETEEE